MKTENVVYVVGADLDIELVKNLVKGDQVLCEMNGARIFSNYENPLVTDEPWSVVSNDDKKLVLRHSQMSRTLTLPYNKLLNLRERDPAVFLLNDKYLAPGRVYIILQFVSHCIPESQIVRQFPMAFDAEAVLKESRKEVLEAIVDKFSEFVYPGWSYMGVCRFALRSSVRVPVINALREKNWKLIKAQKDPVILRIMKEMNWLPYLLAQSHLYTGSTWHEPAYKKVTDGNALPSTTDE